MPTSCRWLLPVACLALLVWPCGWLNAAAPCQQAVYRWDGTNGVRQVDAYIAWLGQPDCWAESFVSYDTWWDIASPAWLFNAWSPWVQARPGRRLILSVSMLSKAPEKPTDPKPTLAIGATGAYNKWFKLLAENLVAKGMGNSIIRIGWEMNGGWFIWAANGKQADYIAYWQHIVTTMRAVPGANFQFCFNPVYGWQQFEAFRVYPGDEYVDVIALDIYDECWAPDTYPIPAGASEAEKQRRWNNAWAYHKTQYLGLDWWRKFARDRNKPFAFGEWGVNQRPDNQSGGDNPVWVEKMHAWMAANDVAWAVYFDVQAPDGHHQLSPHTDGTQFPRASAKFLELFGGTSPGQASPLFADAFTGGNTSAWSRGSASPWSTGGTNTSTNFPSYKVDPGWGTAPVSKAGAGWWANYTLKADVNITRMETWSYCYLFGRYADDNNFYEVCLFKDATTTHARLRKRSGGVTTTLATAPLPVVTNATRVVELTMDEGTITVRVDGTSVLSATDPSPILAGGIALGASKQTVLFDNIVVTSLPGVPATFASMADWAAHAVRMNPAAVTDPQADPDGDGVVSLFEVAAGTDAFNRASVSRVAGGFANGALTLRYRAVLGAPVTLHGKASSDLSTWRDSFDGQMALVEDEVVSNGDGTETVTLKATPATMALPKVFLRLEAAGN